MVWGKDRITQCVWALLNLTKEYLKERRRPAVDLCFCSRTGSVAKRSPYKCSVHDKACSYCFAITSSRERRMNKLCDWLTLSVPVVFLNSPNLSPYFSLNKFERIWFLIFSGWLCLINSHFLITKCHILFVLYKEKLAVDNWLALKGLKKTFGKISCFWLFQTPV